MGDAEPVVQWGYDNWNKDVVFSGNPGGWTNHVISIVGYGETAYGQKYWAIRNSWGTYWGNEGFFKLERGTNSLVLKVTVVDGPSPFCQNHPSKRGVLFDELLWAGLSALLVAI